MPEPTFSIRYLFTMVSRIIFARNFFPVILPDVTTMSQRTILPCLPGAEVTIASIFCQDSCFTVYSSTALSCIIKPKRNTETYINMYLRYKYLYEARAQTTKAVNAYNNTLYGKSTQPPTKTPAISTKATMNRG